MSHIYRKESLYNVNNTYIYSLLLGQHICVVPHSLPPLPLFHFTPLKQVNLTAIQQTNKHMNKQHHSTNYKSVFDKNHKVHSLEFDTSEFPVMRFRCREGFEGARGDISYSRSYLASAIFTGLHLHQALS